LKNKKIYFFVISYFFLTQVDKLLNVPRKQLTPGSSALFEKLAGPQLVRKSLTLMGTEVSLPHSQDPMHVSLS